MPKRGQLMDTAREDCLSTFHIGLNPGKAGVDLSLLNFSALYKIALPMKEEDHA